MLHAPKLETDLPSYEEVTKDERLSSRTSDDVESQPSRSRGQRVFDQMTVNWAQHVRAIVGDYVMGKVERKALRGVGKVTIALMPRDTASSQEGGYRDSRCYSCNTSMCRASQFRLSSRRTFASLQ